VLDPNLLVSAAISPAGPPRQIVSAWIDERFDEGKVLLRSTRSATPSDREDPPRSRAARGPADR
jgi:hypothetical protein